MSTVWFGKWDRYINGSMDCSTQYDEFVLTRRKGLV